MRAVHGRSARVPRAPTFEANHRLKFTPGEQQAIQTAERAFGYRPHSGIIAQPRPNRGLALAIGLTLAYLLFSTFVVAVLHSFLSPDSPRENQAPMAEAVEREPQSQAIASSSTYTFQSRANIDQSSPEVMPQPSSLEIQPQEETCSEPETRVGDGSKTLLNDDRNEPCGEGLRALRIKSQPITESPEAGLTFGQARPCQFPCSSDGSVSFLPDENGRVIFVNDDLIGLPK